MHIDRPRRATVNKMKKHPTPTHKEQKARCDHSPKHEQTLANLKQTKTTSVQHQRNPPPKKAANNPSTKQTALTFGTLLSSQRTDTHPPQPSDHLGGNPVNTTRSDSQCQPLVPVPVPRPSPGTQWLTPRGGTA